MRFIPRGTDTGLDLSLLGIIAVGVGLYLGMVADAGRVAPDLLRFFDVPPDTTYTAVMPQDKALLLLGDPSTGGSTATAADAVSVGALPELLLVAGAVAIAAGPVLFWIRRD